MIEIDRMYISHIANSGVSVPILHMVWDYEVWNLRFNRGTHVFASLIWKKHYLANVENTLTVYVIAYDNLHDRKWRHINHASEPLYSSSAVISGWLQSRAQNLLFLFTVIYSMNNFFTFFTTVNFNDDFFFIWNYEL